MLFLGTKQYPKEGEYEAFLNERGGSSNAYTAMEDTNYYFTVRSSWDGRTGGKGLGVRACVWQGRGGGGGTPPQKKTTR